MNRLNFSKIVNKNLHNLMNPIPLNDDVYDQERFDTKLKYARQQHNLGKKLDGMVAQVYEQLNERQNSPNRTKAQLSKLNKQSESKQKTTKKSSPKSKEETNVQNLSIPRLKVEKNCKEKQKRASERKSLKSQTTDYDNYKRMSKVFERHVELENLVAHHKHLREHRQSIAQEIFAMRHSLDDIKHRLNNSFKFLENKKTYTESQRLEKSDKSKKDNANEKEKVSTV